MELRRKGIDRFNAESQRHRLWLPAKLAAAAAIAGAWPCCARKPWPSRGPARRPCATIGRPRRRTWQRLDRRSALGLGRKSTRELGVALGGRSRGLRLHFRPPRRARTRARRRPWRASPRGTPCTRAGGAARFRPGTSASTSSIHGVARARALQARAAGDFDRRAALYCERDGLRGRRSDRWSAPQP